MCLGEWLLIGAFLAPLIVWTLGLRSIYRNGGSLLPPSSPERTGEANG